MGDFSRYISKLIKKEYERTFFFQEPFYLEIQDSNDLPIDVDFLSNNQYILIKLDKTLKELKLFITLSGRFKLNWERDLWFTVDISNGEDQIESNIKNYNSFAKYYVDTIFNSVINQITLNNDVKYDEVENESIVYYKNYFKNIIDLEEFSNDEIEINIKLYERYNKKNHISSILPEYKYVFNPQPIKNQEHFRLIKIIKLPKIKIIINE